MSTATPQGTQLTERQAEFLELIQEGRTPREIAMQFGISVGTVRATLFQARGRCQTIAGATEITITQLEIIALVGAGMSNAEIGKRLYLAPKTVEHYLRFACERLGARGRMQAVMVAVAREYLVLDADGNVSVPGSHKAAA
jgi:DNA-binding CsgD family transcriptional regulator